MKSFLFLTLCCFGTAQPNFQCLSDAECLNDGECLDSLNFCRCPAGFGGEDCSATCPRVCQNGGTCRFHNDISHGSDQDGTTFCKCMPNFLGVSCEMSFVQCGSLRCLHGGTCDGGACKCPYPRKGDQCQYESLQDPRIPAFECQDNAECLNGGRCIDMFLEAGNNYCQCPVGFGGDDCASTCRRACQNGGSCRFHQDISHGSDQDGDTKCECPPLFLGVDCEIPYVSCPGRTEVKCLHGGTCQQSSKGYQCQCPGSRKGLVCQYSSSQEEAQHMNTSSSGNSKDDQMSLLLLSAALAGVGGIVICVTVVLTRRKQPIDTTPVSNPEEMAGTKPEMC